ncbi:hypothetical protein [Bdellovibrio sp. HCB-162]|uniref:hypothetical protein n=1 Tax=Bdellovibrio sp. HCB-162 TaxID=3394234 RepID=UPI0039BCA454
MAGKDFDSLTEWNVAFDGKQIGKIKTKPGNSSYDSQVDLQDILGPKNKIPKVGKLTSEFATWSDYQVQRPLVTLFKGHASDPDKWRPAPLPNELISKARIEFKNKYTNVSKCKDEDSTFTPWKYKDEDIKVYKRYMANSNWKLIALHLTDNKCDGPPEEAYNQSWYAVSPSGEVTFLDSGLALVDAGDYDRDGKSEVIFQVSRYNRGGYILFYDKFKQREENIFGYH